ncbi:MAG: hypothetical protein QM773_13430 [Hyphomonadaceae bacterium]
MSIASGLDIGPFELKTLNVALVVDTKPGAYILGEENSKGGITVSYVGRADKDLRDRLLQHAREGTYQHFKCHYTADARAAYLLECKLFHLFGGTALLANEIHPDRPIGHAGSCPHCP